MPAPHAWAYNWGLRVKQERYRASTKSPTAIALHRELNALKKTDVPWMYEVSKCAPQEALWNLDAGFQQFFRRCALKKQGKWKGETGLSPVQDQEEGAGELPTHWPDRGLREGDRAATPGGSGCGWLDADLTLSDRTFHCQQCGLVLDRDLNAAINLAQLAGSSSDSQNARCEPPALARSESRA